MRKKLPKIIINERMPSVAIEGILAENGGVS